MKQAIIDFFFPPPYKKLRERYIKQNGYPKEDVIIGDYYGNLGRIVGINTFKRVIMKKGLQ